MCDTEIIVLPSLATGRTATPTFLVIFNIYSLPILNYILVPHFIIIHETNYEQSVPLNS